MAALDTSPGKPGEGNECARDDAPSRCSDATHRTKPRCVGRADVRRLPIADAAVRRP
ncbi:hypothetical protein ebA4501 [Aromatoleum aromaticum EbN1]|uniref:Uncharacterized protein n=1 Tax=Aromatoleum aromaticum (strain DSM 19018 / LMG 30748 / EbN1) TaxID=76114 RepID=Q5P1Y6_AROAE|nr:hypothetical protein ebA4501 [Aromatoleum aromaticum EbN1]